MAIAPQKLREIIFLLIYSSDFSESDEADITGMLMQELAVSKTVMRLAHEKKKLIQEKLSEIDLIITEYSESYDFERIPRVERNILRLGLYELLFSSNIPSKVAIAEAIRLTRKFATSQAASFVNAILDAIYQNQEKKREETPDAIPLSV